ncbi:MAG TPA: hypothetical protein VF275_03190 [Gammaproteobacteria bacterium]
MDGYETALLLIGGALGFFLRSFLGSYMREKGKNAATKEDIGVITSKVENIRTQLAEESRFFLSRRANQEKHLLAFHDVAIELLHERFAVNFGDIPMDNGRSLYEFQTAFNQNIVVLLREYQRLILFLPSEHELITYSTNLVKSAMEAKVIFKSRFGAIKFTSVEEANAYASGDKEAYRSAVSRSNEANNEFWNEIHPHIESYKTALELFVKELGVFLSSPRISDVDARVID